MIYYTHNLLLHTENPEFSKYEQVLGKLITSVAKKVTNYSTPKDFVFDES